MYEGRGWTRTGAHTYGYNTNSIGISLLGNFVSASPSQESIDAMVSLIALGKELVRILNRNMIPSQQ